MKGRVPLDLLDGSLNGHRKKNKQKKYLI
jgi:hypothetical protein